MVITPGDVLARCKALDARIEAASKAIEQAPPSALDQAFRDAWDARRRRWHELRTQCADWSSRWWNYKWGPRLDDWFENQTAWERDIEARTARAIPVPAPVVPDEHPTLPSASDVKRFGANVGIGVGIVVAAGLGALLLSRRRS